jgi:hypothetical protein
MSYDVAVFAIETRKQGPATSYRVRWRVDAKRFTRTFPKKGLAESFRSELIVATRKGEDFSTETGLPASMDRARTDVTFYNVAAEFTSSAWPSVSAKQRASIRETLSRVVPAVVRDVPAAPDPSVLRLALTHSLIQGPAAPELAADELAALGWIRRASRPVTALSDASAVADVLDALAVNLDGNPAPPAYFSRRRASCIGPWATRSARNTSKPTRWKPSRRDGPRPLSPRKRSIPARSAARSLWSTCSTCAARSVRPRARGSGRSTAACTTG